MTSSSHKDIPEYDEAVVCENPECKHLEAAPLTGLYGIAGGGGLGVYSVCEHCGTVLTKSIDSEMCETHENIGHTDLMISPEAIDEATKDVEIKDVEGDTKSGTDEHK